MEDVNTSNVALNISVVSDMNSDSLTVGVECDDDGNVVRIIVVSSEEDMQKVTDSLNEKCFSQGSGKAVDGED